MFPEPPDGTVDSSPASCGNFAPISPARGWPGDKEALGLGLGARLGRGLRLGLGCVRLGKVGLVLSPDRLRLGGRRLRGLHDRNLLRFVEELLAGARLR